jgi:hypothetical protein
LWDMDSLTFGPSGWLFGKILFLEFDGTYSY